MNNAFGDDGPERSSWKGKASALCLFMPFIAVTFAVVLAWSSCVAKAETPSSRSRETTDTIWKKVLRINIDGQKPDTGEQETRSGTGVVVSESGYVLTAAHLVSEKGADLWDLKITGRWSGEASSAGLTMQLIKVDRDSGLALLKLPHSREPYDAAPICFSYAPAISNSMSAVGFPMEKELTWLEGTFSNTGGSKGRWQVSIPFTHGMSGGAVLVNGTLVAIVNSGLKEAEAIRWVTPISYAKNLLSSVTGKGVKDSCFQEETTERGKSGLKMAVVPITKFSTGISLHISIANQMTSKRKYNIPAIRVEVRDTGTGRPDASIFGAHGPSPVSTAVIAHGKKDKIYWIDEKSKCTTSRVYGNNVLDALPITTEIILSPGELFSIRLQSYSEVAGKFTTTVFFEWLDDNLNLITERHVSEEWSSIGGRAPNEKNCNLR